MKLLWHPSETKDGEPIVDLLTNRLKEWLEKHVEVIRPNKDKMSRRVLLKEVDRLSGI